MNGAEKIVNAMKKVNESNQQVPSQIISATIISVEPLVFQLENRLKIDSNFYELSGLTDWTKVQVGDVFKGFSFNEGQKYFILDAIAAASTSGNSSSVINQLQEAVAQAKGITIPIGGGCDYFGAVEPENFMFADGRALNIADYIELYLVIGESYRKDNNLDYTTFNIPDKRDATAIMKDSLNGNLGDIIGSNTKQIEKGNIPNYNLTVTDPKHRHRTYIGTGTGSGNFVGVNANAVPTTGFNTNTEEASTGITVNSGGSGTALNVRQKSLICNYIIRVK